MCRIILYAISLANDDQNDHDVGKNRLLTKEGIARLALYHTSIGRLLLYVLWFSFIVFFKFMLDLFMVTHLSSVRFSSKMRNSYLG